jgi:hypothetical protein
LGRCAHSLPGRRTQSTFGHARLDLVVLYFRRRGTADHRNTTGSIHTGLRVTQDIDWKSVEQRLPITWTACHLGSQANTLMGSKRHLHRGDDRTRDAGPLAANAKIIDLLALLPPRNSSKYRPRKAITVANANKVSLPRKTRVLSPPSPFATTSSVRSFVSCQGCSGLRNIPTKNVKCRCDRPYVRMSMRRPTTRCGPGPRTPRRRARSRVSRTRRPRAPL